MDRSDQRHHARRGIDSVGSRVAAVVSKYWFLAVALCLGFPVVLFAQVAWNILDQSAPHVTAQMQMLISMLQAAIAYSVGLAVLHSSKTTAAMARQTEKRDVEQRHTDRIGRFNALTGAAVEAAAYGGALAQFQHTNLKTWRMLWPEGAAQREIAIATWSSLLAAVARASKALERLRYTDDELLDSAEELFDVVVEIQRLASAGHPDDVVNQAGRIRDLANQLQQSIRMQGIPASG